MHRRLFLATVLAATAWTVPSIAQTLEERLVSQLRAQGFGNISVSRTLLGRTRIVASSSDERREIIFNPRTGEILRDYWQLLAGGNVSDVRLIEGGSGRSGSNSGSSGGDDDDDDDSGSGSGGDDDDDGR